MGGKEQKRQGYRGIQDAEQAGRKHKPREREEVDWGLQRRQAKGRRGKRVCRGGGSTAAAECLGRRLWKLCVKL